MSRFRPKSLLIVVSAAVIFSFCVDPALAQTVAPDPLASASASPAPAPTETSAPSPVATTPAPIATQTSTSTVPAPVTNIPSLFIDLPAGYSLDDLHRSKDNIPRDPGTEPHATATIVDATTPANNVNASLEAIKGRGNFTWSLEKKPYQIKFDSSTSVLGMAKAKTWILLANHADPSLLRNKVAYDLAVDFGLPGSPDSRFIDLTIDGHYAGSYLITEKVEVKTNRLELTHPEGVLAEMDNLYGLAEDFHFRANTSRSIFVLKDAVGDVDAPLTGPVAKGYAGFQSHLAEFETYLYARDPDWSRISAMIDVDSFIKYYFVLEFAANPDAIQSSVYLWRDGPDDVLHAGPAWDFDIAFGNYSYAQFGGDPAQDYIKNAPFLRAQGNDWYSQLFRNEEFVELLNETFEAELEPKIKAVVGKIDAYTTGIVQSSTTNFALWSNVLGRAPVFGSGRTLANTWSGEVAHLREWVAARTAHLSAAHGSDMALVSYSSHVANIGWQPTLTSGQIAGTAGRSLQVEAIDIALSGIQGGGGLQSRSHVQDSGWSEWQSGNTRLGTTGASRRLEAFQLKLTGAVASRYDISYRVHVQNIGWMPWVSNGSSAGTTGQGLRIEAIQIRMLESDPKPTVTYTTHVQNIGWMTPASDGEIAGTTGRSLAVEAVSATAASNEFSGGLEYRAHVQNIGWMSWTASGAHTGTVGRTLRMEALQVKLTGEMSEQYTVRYRAHVQGIGWQSWVSDGQTAGTTDRALRVEAIEMELVPRAH